MIYDESQGILDIAVKLFMLSQVRAISTGMERVGVQIIKQVARDSLRLVQPMLDALRSGIPSRIAKYEDISPIDMDEEIEKYESSINLQEKVRIQKKIQNQKRQKKEQSIKEEVILQLLAMDFEPNEVMASVNKVFKRFGEDIEKTQIIKETVKILIEKDDKKIDRKIGKKRTKSTNDSYLGRLMEEARKEKKSVHEWFLKKNIVKQPLDEFWEEDEHGHGQAPLVSNTVS